MVLFEDLGLTKAPPCDWRCFIILPGRLPRRRSLVTICDAPFREIVGRKFHVDAIAHQDPDAVPSHSTRYGREHNMFGIVDLDLKKSIRLFIDHNSG